MNASGESVGAADPGRREFEFLSGAHSDQLLAMIMALAAEVESLFEWKISLADALRRASIDVDSIMADSRGDGSIAEACAQSRRDLVGRLFAAAMPESDPAKPTPLVRSSG